MEVIPRTLAQNCGSDVVRVLTELRAKHASEGGKYFGINGNTGKIDDMKAANVWDPLAVKVQTYKTAIESACMLLRIDDIVSGIKKEKKEHALSVNLTEREFEILNLMQAFCILM